MSWVAAAIGGSALLGAYSSRKAAKAQQDSAQQGIDAQREMFDQQRQLQEPFREGGLQGFNQLNRLLGIGTPLKTLEDQYYQEMRDLANQRHRAAYGMDIESSPDTNSLNYFFTETRKAAKQKALEAQQREQQSEGFGSLMQDFSAEDFQQDPGYAFRLSEGMKALDRSAAARGGLQSGAALKAAARYGQDMASQEYQNAFNRYQINRQNKLQPLMFLTGVGQSAASGQAAAAGQLGQGMAAGYGAMGNAQAAGQIGTANAISGGLGSYLNYQQGQNYLQALRRPSTYNSYVPGYGYGTSPGE